MVRAQAVSNSCGYGRERGEGEGEGWASRVIYVGNARDVELSGLAFRKLHG